jgi:uncharacterized protein YggE
MKNLFGLFSIVLALTFAFAPARAAAQQITVNGNLARTVEAGGWLIVEKSKKYLLLNAGKFTGESWFREGTRVTATGEVKSDVITIYQEGTPFEASTLRQAGTSTGNGAAGAAGRVTTVTVNSNARVSVQPDTAIISVAVVTQAKGAGEAQQQNAAKTAAVLDALKRAAGAGAEIKTSGYSLVPQRIYRQNQPPTLTGYEARNSVTVTLSDLSRVGAIIDAATQAGANNIDGISFTLRRDREAHNRALAEATRGAVAKAESLAQTLGGRVMRIVAVEEAGAPPRPVVYARAETFATESAPDTPIEVGALDINAQVRLIAEIETAAAPR